MDSRMSVVKMVTATGIATAVMFDEMPRLMNFQPSSCSTLRKVAVRDKSVLNILHKQRSIMHNEMSYQLYMDLLVADDIQGVGERGAGDARGHGLDRGSSEHGVLVVRIHQRQRLLHIVLHCHGCYILGNGL
jgi:hypothetical protein